jgi:conjugal transfer mating pair stabilization protein TraN
MCVETDAAGNCTRSQDVYKCPSTGTTTATVGNCPANVFCLGGSCFNTSYTNDADFARSMSMMEAAREAGVYFDPDKLEVFKGEASSCGDRLLKNCCSSDSAGKGMTNQRMFGSGSRLVYDALMNDSNRQFITEGLTAALTSSGFSGTYSTYGITVAVNGSALPAGSTVLYASSTEAGSGFVVAFDPWSLVIAIVIYIIVSMMTCNEEESKLAMRTGAGLCHEVGSYCSHSFLGGCSTTTHAKCCFNSMLARIVNEQGRAQIGKGWGPPQAVDCSGFTVKQLQALDFGVMDLSEFYASIVPTLPNAGNIQGNNLTDATKCYYGQGKC